MAEPLIPYEIYDKFGELRELESKSERIEKIREIVGELPRLNFNTLAFTMDFFRELSSH